jgi:CoA:oxalate CoA-transferase
MYATIAILARLHERDRRSETDEAEGAFVGKFDVGLFDAIVSIMNEYLTFHEMTGEVPGPQGTSHQSLVPYQLFETADGHVVTGVPSDDRWDDFVDVVGREELRTYETNDQRVEHAEAVVAVIQEEFAKRPTDYWLAELTERGFPNGPLNDVGDVLAHEQARARGLVRSVEDPDAGEVVLPGHPVHFPDFETEIRDPAPRLGEHTDEVFASVADDQTTLDEWREAGAFGGDGRDE